MSKSEQHSLFALCINEHNHIYIPLFVRQFPEQDGISYSVHPFMRSDWLNEVWGGRQDVTDDYKFVYMGPAGTWCVVQLEKLY